jgi:hypothetical protein
MYRAQKKRKRTHLPDVYEGPVSLVRAPPKPVRHVEFGLANSGASTSRARRFETIPSPTKKRVAIQDVERGPIFESLPKFNANPSFAVDEHLLDPFSSFGLQDGDYVVDGEYEMEIGATHITPAHPVKKRFRVSSLVTLLVSSNNTQPLDKSSPAVEKLLNRRA